MPKQLLTREKIVDIGVALIEDGKELTFSAVAKKLGSRSQAIYTYFKNVDELKYTIIAWALSIAGRRMQCQLFGQSGIEAIIEFAKQFRALALRHDRLSRFVLSAVRTTKYPEVDAALDVLKKLLNQLLEGTFKAKRLRILASRCIRDLIVGDIINVGTGWFTSGEMSTDQSFDQNLRHNLELFQRMN
ncbi:TetR/AcrR family transcriptional regulator [Lactiplantibacillus plantarum]|jgi:AcrR family transcriptional regulator|uniref:TetR/AcrR family transcriptional regulator n=1 Tax=Lactiplantibacillus plantarum TaxID=1590 RepID=UPI0007B5575F|nr:TetR/AcrR family transcriptional regulator [Lactiplantibacillus plantarum]KZU38663.1 Transcriptional regulator TetR family [Lactiplantibacillus plantarum]